MAPPETCPFLPSLPVVTSPTQGCHAEDRVNPLNPRMDRQWPAVSLLREVTVWQIHVYNYSFFTHYIYILYCSLGIANS